MICTVSEGLVEEVTFAGDPGKNTPAGGRAIAKVHMWSMVTASKRPVWLGWNKQQQEERLAGLTM